MPYQNGGRSNSKRPGSDQDTPSFRLARSVLRLYTDPTGILVSELRENLGIQERAFRNYKHRLERVLTEFLPVGAKLEARGRGVERRLRVVTPIGATASWQLVARLAAHDLINSLLGFMREAEFAKQLRLAEQELLGRMDRNMTTSIRKNFARMFYVVPDAPKDYSSSDAVAVLDEIVRALTYSTRIEVHYSTPGKKPAVHELEPLTLGLHRSALYLFARFKDSEKVYNFAIDRIAKARGLKGNYYKYPAAKDWSPDRHFERSFGVFTPPATKKQAIAVDLVFADLPWLKAHIRERRWMPGQSVDDMQDGRLRLRFQANSAIELKPWIAQWGDLVEVRSPEL